MPAKLTTDEHFNAIFKPPAPEDRHTGRSRKCKMCGDWHPRDKPWPHNCRPARDIPPQILDAPMVAPAFEAFKTGVLDGAEVINSRDEKREYMKKHDLVEYDEGVTNEPTWAEQKEAERDYVEAFKAFSETDTDYYTPEQKGEVLDDTGSLDEGTEIDTDVVEVIE